MFPLVPPNVKGTIMSQFAALLVIITTITGANGRTEVERTEVPVISKELCLMQGKIEVSDPNNELGGRGNIQADYEKVLKGDNPYGLKLIEDDRHTEWSCEKTTTSWEPIIQVVIQRKPNTEFETHNLAITEWRMCKSTAAMSESLLQREFLKKNGHLPTYLKLTCTWKTDGTVTGFRPDGTTYEVSEEYPD